MSGWVLLAHGDDLAAHGCWATGWIGAIPVLVRNFNGTLRGFRNVCSHRFALMLTEPTGKGPLRCPYHAWVYDQDGVPKAIPFNDSDFHLDDAARRALALPAIGVAMAGGLVFAHLDPNADSAVPADWTADNGTERTLPDGSVIGPGSAILYRSSARREGAC
ncbi:MAG: Rieske 2Fe-2S domain-containing protein [Niveispirillum sp.]|uniref:Rieske 2Fe-2S domain-containing protein n=1 Tax=Niveispirillum sp. TaxID=1917217 RepID=UPI0006B97BDA